MDGLGQNYVAEVPVSFVGWTRPPEVLYREHSRNKGHSRRRKFPRLKVRNTPAVEVRNILTWSPILRKVSWETYRVKDGTKGPMIWEAKRISFWIKDENGMPSRPHHLMVARKVLKPTEVRFFLSTGGGLWDDGDGCQCLQGGVSAEEAEWIE